MFGITNYASFIIAVVVFLAIPGPGLLGILAATGKGGVRAGFAGIMGTMAGDWVHMLLAGIGVAALLQANPVVFKGIQYLGAGYLIYIGISLLRSKFGEDKAANEVPAGQYFRRLFLITLMNPKAIVFYMAFFPLFIDPASHHGAWTLLAMAATVSLLTVAFCLSLVLLLNQIAGKLKHNRYVSKVAHRAAGIFLIGFGVKLTTN